MVEGDGRGWQQRYDQSVKEEELRIAEAEADESEWAKLVARSSYTGTVLDLVFLPYVLIVFGIPALRRHLRKRRSELPN